MLNIICDLDIVLTIMKEYHAQQQDPNQLYNVCFTVYLFILVLFT